MIKIKNKIGKPTNLYRLALQFMEGDADGWQTEHVDIPEAEIESQEVKDLISTIQKMIKLDSKGRGGMDSSGELIRHYKKAGISEQDLCKFFELYLDKDETIAPSKYVIEYPTESEGYYYSTYTIVVTYFDSEGNEFETEII